MQLRKALSTFIIYTFSDPIFEKKKKKISVDHDCLVIFLLRNWNTDNNKPNMGRQNSALSSVHWSTNRSYTSTAV